MKIHNLDCLFCGYPRRSDECCPHCAGTFPCCDSARAGESAALERVAELEAELEENKRLRVLLAEAATILELDWHQTLADRIRAALKRPDGAGGE